MAPSRLGRLLIVALTAFAAGSPAVAAAQQPVAAQQPPAPQGGPPPPGRQGGPGGGLELKNVQVLKDLPPDQWQPLMLYVSASLGVQCNYCHVQGDNASDDKEPKKVARKMMQMVADMNGQFFEGKPVMSCASCHNGHLKPSRVPPLAVNMTPEEAAAAAAGRGRRGGGAGGPAGPPGRAGEPGAPAANAGRGGGRGPGGPPAPPPVTETVAQVIGKYEQALGGRPALQNVKTRVMTGALTNRDLTTADFTVTEKSTGEARIEIAAAPNPIVRTTDGKAAWQVGGGGPPGAGPRDLSVIQAQQGFRLADLTLPLKLRGGYKNLSVKKAYESVEGKPVVVLTGSPAADVTEELAFDRESGLLLRRSITTGSPLGFGIMSLPEQVDYSDYRDVDGVKVPFTVRHATSNAVTAEKITDVKINTPVADTIFAKP